MAPQSATDRGERPRARFVEADVAYLPAAALDPGAPRDELPAADELSGTEVRIIHPGSADEQQLLEFRMAPGLRIRPHSHDVDEIVYVLAGELHFGTRVCGPGASVTIPAHTRYGFRVGPDGARFLNFRSRADTSYNRAPAGA